MMLSLITSQSPNVIAKNITLQPDGSLRKTSTAYMMRGSANIMTFDTLEQFNGLLDQLAPCHALAFGVPSVDNSLIVKASDLHKNPGAISRSDKYLAWPQGKGILFLDYDPDSGEETMQPQALLDVLSASLGQCGMLWRPSASGFIYDANTGEELDGLKGQHVYITVADASDIPRAGAVLFKRLWLAGHGRIVLAQNGAMLVRSLVDGAVWQPSRLDFAAGAVCGQGIVRNPPQGVVRDGPVLDTRQALPDLSAEEERQYAQLVEQAKNNSAPQSANVREQYITQRAQEEGVSVEAVRARYEMAEQMNVLCGDFPIEMANGEIYSVAQILANPSQFHEKICLDPVEPEYNNRHPVGKLYLDSKGTFLDSKAHGGRVFVLGIDTGEAFKAAAKDGDTFADALKSIRQTGGELDNVEELTKHINTGPFSPFQRAALTSELEGQLKENKRLTPAIKAMIGSAPAGTTSTNNPVASGAYCKKDGHNAALFASSRYPKGLRIYDEEWYAYTGKGWERLSSSRMKGEMTAAMINAEGVQQSHVDSAYRTLFNLSSLYDGAPVNETPEHLLLFQNGVLDTCTGQMTPHTPDLFCTNVLPYDFDPAATAPQWVAWLNSIFDGDQERISLLQEWMGYMLVRSYRYQKIMLFLGPPRAGKGVIGRMLKAVVGNGNYQGISLGNLLQDSILNNLRDTPVVYIGESERGALGRQQGEVVERLKMVSGGDPLAWDRKYMNATSATLPCRFTMSSNHVPQLFDDSSALAARMLIIPFTHSFTGDAEDPHLFDRLSCEVQGIALWGLQGLARLRTTGKFTYSEMGAFEAEAIEEATNPMRVFIRERCVLEGDEVVQVGEVYNAYCAWCTLQGEIPLRQRTFSGSFKAAISGLGRQYGNHRDATGTQRKGYKGITLLGGAQAPDNVASITQQAFRG